MAYRLKHTYFQGRPVGICLQNLNGPCPLIAITNVLSLHGRIKFLPDEKFVYAETLFGHISRLVSCKSSATPITLNSNEIKVIQDALAILPKLQSGIDLNIQFSDIRAFEYTTECSVFDLLGVPLVHGWVMDDRPGASKLLHLSYNHMIEKAIGCDSSSSKKAEEEKLNTDKSEADVVGFLCADFLRDTASQLTQTGLQALREKLKEEQLCVFFRNNHFSTLYKKFGRLFLLVTDEGYSDFPDVIWENLESVTGDTCYSDITLGLRPHIPLPVASPVRPVPSAPVRPGDKPESDEALARRLQEQDALELQRAKEQRVAQKLTEERASAHALDTEGLRAQATARAIDKRQTNEAFWAAEAARAAQEQASRR